MKEAFDAGVQVGQWKSDLHELELNVTEIDWLVANLTNLMPGKLNGVSRAAIPRTIEVLMGHRCCLEKKYVALRKDLAQYAPEIEAPEEVPEIRRYTYREIETEDETTPWERK